ncbi:MAG TPA: RDD family protein [Cellulomonas sp.]
MTVTTPPTAAPPAPLGRRVAASLVDAAATSVAGSVLWLAVLPTSLDALRSAGSTGAASVGVTVGVSPVLLLVGAVLLLGWGGFQWWCQGTRGWTVGRRLLGLRTVDVRTARPIGLGRALGRAMVVALGSLVCAVGQLVVLASVLMDGTGRHRGWHDRVADAIVVDVRGLPAAGRVARMPAPRRVEVPGPDAADGSGWTPPVPPAGAAATPPATSPAAAPAPAPAPGAARDEVGRTRWGTLAAGRQLDAPDLVLPPLGTPGLAPDMDTRAIPVVPAAPGGAPSGPTGTVPYHPPGLLPPAAPAPGAAATPWPPAPYAPAPAPYAPPAAPAPAPAYGAPALGSPYAPPSAPAPGPGAPLYPAPAPQVGGRHSVAPGAPPEQPAADLPGLPPMPAAPTAPVPGPGAVGGVTAPADAPGWAVRLPDGTLVGLEAPLLVGRNPDPVPGARTVNVQDPSRSVSKTHLMIGLDPDGPWVVDRGSTNGTLVTLPDGQRIVCLPDRRVRLAEGSVVAFGDLSLTLGVRA